MSKFPKEETIALCIENSLSSHALIPSILKFTGFRIITVEADDNILEISKYHLPDVIILDLWGEDELEICQALKADDKVKDIPIIVLLPSSKIELQKKAIKAGAASYLLKPIDVENFQIVLKSYYPRA